MTEISSELNSANNADLSLEGLKHAELNDRIVQILVERRANTFLGWLREPQNEQKVLAEERELTQSAFEIPAHVSDLAAESNEFNAAEVQMFEEVSSNLKDKLMSEIELPPVEAALSEEEKLKFVRSNAGKIIAIVSAPIKPPQMFPEELLVVINQTPLKGLVDIMSEEIGNELHKLEERRTRLITVVRETIPDEDFESLKNPDVERAVFRQIFKNEDAYIEEMNLDGNMDHAKKRALERFQEECKDPMLQMMLGMIIPKADTITSGHPGAAIFRELLILDAKWLFLDNV